MKQKQRISVRKMSAKPKTLTLPLDSQTAALLEQIKTVHQVKTSAGMIRRMIEDWQTLAQDLERWESQAQHFEEQYDDLFSSVQSMKGDLVHLVKRLDVPLSKHAKVAVKVRQRSFLE